MRASDHVFSGNWPATPRRAVIIFHSDHCMPDIVRRSKLKASLSKELNLAHLHPKRFEPIFPIRQGGFRNRQVYVTHLPHAFNGFHAKMRYRKSSQQGALLSQIIAVVKVIDRCCTVIEKRALAALEAQHFCMPIEVALGIHHTYRHVVMVGQRRTRTGG